ncbi:MAG: hypothetical protein HW421_1758 [Ignavibacteria bacterium]|nr:hypothetical protein [Ignavibacteria bacterium]
MIVTYSLVNELFRAFHIKRWNDRLRPMELIEMDKHAHKMIIAYCLGKYEEMKGVKLDWNDIIRFGIYELLRRIVISDIKSTIYREIKKDKEAFKKLNEYIFEELEGKITDDAIKAELHDFLLNPQSRSRKEIRILEAAHIIASLWEFRIIKTVNPTSYQNIKIEADLLNDIVQFNDLEGVQKITSQHKIANFVDLCSQLRFQFRWAQTPRVPNTSVLGHCMLVACVSYFFTRDIPNCPKRLYNNFFGGLFHDLPEAVTRDIISPVKRSSKEFHFLILKLERELAEKEIFPHIEPAWIDELKYFTQCDMQNKIVEAGSVSSRQLSVEEITNTYNKDEFVPFDGEIVSAADHLSAFLESWHSCSSGIKSDELIESAKKISEMNRTMNLGGIPVNELYSAFLPIG